LIGGKEVVIKIITSLYQKIKACEIIGGYFNETNIEIQIKKFMQVFKILLGENG